MVPGKEIETVLTEFTVEQVAAAFVEACWRVNLNPTHDLIVMLLAHSALETGHWKIMRCYNFGNVKATGGWIAGGGDFCYYEASENLNAARVRAARKTSRPRTDGVDGMDMEVRKHRADGRAAVWFWPSHIQCRFRAFDTLDDGASAYVAKLMGRYASALAMAMAGRVEGYVDEIHRLGYFTAGLAGYKRLLRILFKRYWSTLTDTTDPAERVGDEIHGVRSGNWTIGAGDD